MAKSQRVFNVVIIGAGPTGASLLERLAANAEELLDGRALHIHLVDPYRAGTGRVWRADLDPRLWMNSLAEDVTMFTDASVRCQGPIRPGPSLAQWTRTVDDATLADLADDDLAREIRAVDALTFPSRRVQAAYLEWFHRVVVAKLPATVALTVHNQRATDLQDNLDGSQKVTLADGSTLLADTVVLALGHLDALPEADGAALNSFAAHHGLTYIAAGHTGDLDLSGLHPGANVIVSGFGQAFTDLVILLSEGRGGEFLADQHGALRYQPSGAEPVLHVGSRRGVPYRSKLDYHLQAPLVSLPHFLDEAAIAELLSRPERLEFERDLFPLVAKEVCWAYYHELFLGHPERTRTTWEDFATRYTPLAWGPEIDALVAECVPATLDRFDFAALDRPLAGLRFASGDETQAKVADHIAADVARRTDPAYSADLGAFMALLVTFGVLARITASGRVSDRSRIQDVAGAWFSFFMYYASGPPPARLRQYLALAEAGILRFLGANLRVTADATLGCFVASSSSHPDLVKGTALVDARIAPASVSRTTDPLLRALYERGDVVEEVVADASGWQANTGKVMVSGSDVKVVQADGTEHRARHGVGAFTNRPASGVLSRPGTNAPMFRQNDTVARSILTTLATLATTGGAQAEVIS